MSFLIKFHCSFVFCFSREKIKHNNNDIHPVNLFLNHEWPFSLTKHNTEDTMGNIFGVSHVLQFILQAFGKKKQQQNMRQGENYCYIELV